jgi:dihydrofolate reductase
MGKLIYTAITSLDGYVADSNGNFDWSAPDDEVHTFVNDLERSVGTYLMGRRLYEVMAAWETMHLHDDDLPAVMRDYTAIWQAADKVVYSRTLTEPSSRRTRIESSFDAAAVRALKHSSGPDISVGGPELAAQMLAAGLVDELRVFVSPVVVGGGQRFLPDDLRLSLDLHDDYQFRNGVAYLAYRIRS